jgi:hypothetical protein
VAKTAGPLLSERASGSIGGSLTFDTHRGMPIVRRRGTTAQPRSSAQLRARSRFARLTRAWRDLSHSHRAQWDIWAAANEPNEEHFYEHTRWSGANAYLACNAILLILGRPVVDTPPTRPKPRPLQSLTATYSAIPIPHIVFWWDPILDFQLYAMVRAACHITTHTHPDKSEYRHKTSILVASPQKWWIRPPRGQLHFLIPTADRRNGLRSQPAYTSCWSDG